MADYQDNPVRVSGEGDGRVIVGTTAGEVRVGDEIQTQALPATWAEVTHVDTDTHGTDPMILRLNGHGSLYAAGGESCVVRRPAPPAPADSKLREANARFEAEHARIREQRDAAWQEVEALKQQIDPAPPAPESGMDDAGNAYDAIRLGLETLESLARENVRWPNTLRQGDTAHERSIAAGLAALDLLAMAKHPPRPVSGTGEAAEAWVDYVADRAGTATKGHGFDEATREQVRKAIEVEFMRDQFPPQGVAEGLAERAAWFDEEMEAAARRERAAADRGHERDASMHRGYGAGMFQARLKFAPASPSTSTPESED